MSVQEIKKKIEDLNLARARRCKWLVATSLCALGITIVCLVIIRNATAGLLQDGPTHDEFISQLTRQISKQILSQTDGAGIQASYGTLALPDAALPIPHHHASFDRSGTDPDHGKLSSALGEEKTNTGLCSAADDPQKPLGRFRERTVSEYQTTVTKIVDNLAAIRIAEGNSIHAGLSASAVASLFVGHVEEGLPKPALMDYDPQAETKPSKDAR